MRQLIRPSGHGGDDGLLQKGPSCHAPLASRTVSLLMPPLPLSVPASAMRFAAAMRSTTMGFTANVRSATMRRGGMGNVLLPLCCLHVHDLPQHHLHRYIFLLHRC